MRFEFKLPDIGEGVIEGEVVKWLVQDGEAIKAEQPVVEIMTDKATVVIPSPKGGKVLERHGKEGEMVKVHSTLLVVETEGGSAQQAASTAAPQATAPAKPPSPPPAPVSRPAPVAAIASAPPAEPARARPQLSAVPPVPSQEEGKVRATPVTRKLAAERGLDLAGGGQWPRRPGAQGGCARVDRRR
jgi:pyruvate/2-oxoglutarate dehydrogenase complex dihydrolipoamide acyltransferase (E2) component